MLSLTVMPAFATPAGAPEVGPHTACVKYGSTDKGARAVEAFVFPNKNKSRFKVFFEI